MPDRMTGVLALVVTSVLWGTTGTAATFAPAVGPLAIAAVSLGLGGLGQAAIAVPALRRARATLRTRRATVLAGGIAVLVYPLAFYSSMRLAGVAVGTVVSVGAAPIFSGILDRVADGQRLSARWYVAAAGGIAGVVLLTLTGRATVTADAAHTLIGVALGLAAAAGYAVYTWATVRLMRRGVDRAAAMGAVFGLGGLLLLPVLLVTGAPLVATGRALAVGAYMALVPMFLGYLLYGFGLRRLTASTATTITLLEPAVATVLAVAIVGETLVATGWAGLALIGAALVILARPPKGDGQ